MTRVKVCGITSQDDALKAAFNGAWAVSFIFYKKSPRYISPSRARKVIEALPPFVTPVGVFVNQSPRAITDVCRFTRISTIQLHGDEDASFCKKFKDYKIIKAFRVGDGVDLKQINRYKVDAYLFDTYKEGSFGGTGQTFNWDMIAGVRVQKPFILSGGLNPENVRKAVEVVCPYAIDVSSGLERSPGVKDPRKIKALFEALEPFK